MRTTSLFAVAAVAVSALVACTADTTNEPRKTDVQKDGVEPLALDAGPGDGGAITPGPVQQYKATSNVATASYYDYWTGNQLFLRAGKGTDGKVHIELSKTEWDPTSQVCIDPPFPPDPSWPPPPPYCYFTRRISTYAFGTVPNTSFRTAPDFVQITANIANGPTMTITSCVEDFYTYPTCSPGAGGLVDVLWHENGWFSSTQTGSREDGFGSFWFRTSGSVSSKGADVLGSVLGTSVDGSQGYTLRSTGAAISFSSYLKP